MSDHPHVCANCKWAVPDFSAETRQFARGDWCHYAPGSHPYMNAYDACSKFEIATNRELDDEYACPPWQEVHG